MAKKTFHLCTTLVVFFLFLLPLWAAESGQEDKGGLLDIHPGLAFWTVITFVTLLIILRAFAWKPLLDAIEERERHIRETLENSEKSRQEATEFLEKSKKSLLDVHEEARTILEKADKKARDLHKEVLQAAQKDCTDLKRNTQKEIQNMHNSVILSQLGQLGDLGIEIASKVMNRSINKEEHTRLIDESIQEIQKRMEAR